MGHTRFRKRAHSLITALVMVAILTTTFLPHWLSADRVPSAAAAAPASADTVTHAADSGAASSRARTAEPVAPVAPNTLLLAETGRIDDLAATIAAAGDTVYVRDGDALIVGLNTLGFTDLAPLGARAAFEGTVSDATLAGLSGPDQELAHVWNDMIGGGVSAREVQDLPGLETTVYLPDQTPPARGTRAVGAPPDSTQTSVFMVGSVAVEVVFVESTTGPENWTEPEITKVKSEVMNALNWWTLAAGSPEELGGPPRPPAHLTWDVNYHTPFNGSSDKVKVPMEPIQTSVGFAADSWMQDVAGAFTGSPPSESAIRAWADGARNVPGEETDWGFILFIVDSSNDADGRFDLDQKYGGAALNGPWAVVTSDAGDMGTDSLEVVIAKMVGHVFGAGDESYDGETDQGCQNDEYYGYLRVQHSNCQREVSSAPSLMLSGADMVDAYKKFNLSDEARWQVGWRDLDGPEGEGDGVYDVIDTLGMNDIALSDTVCPIIHLAAEITNEPDSDSLPFDFGDGDNTEWRARIWNSATGMYTDEDGDPSNDLTFTPVNINRPSFVWGRVDEGEWIAGTAQDGEWDDQVEGYSVQIPGTAGQINKVDLAIMNRWDQTGYLNDNSANISIADPIPGSLYQTTGFNPPVEFYQANGVPGGWSDSPSDPAYSGSQTKFAGGAGREACFGIDGTAVDIIHSKYPTYGTATVYVDGEMHSTIDYNGADTRQVRHSITNLAPGHHAIQIIANEGGSGIIDFDAFEVSDTLADQIISGNPDAVPADVDGNGFYEETGAKLLFVGDWNSVGQNAPDRPGGGGDGTAQQTTQPLDRMYFRFRAADTVAIYRRVFNGAGTADVYLNNAFWGTMNNEADYDKTANKLRPFYISGLPSNVPHTVEIRLNEGAPSLTVESLRLLNMAGEVAPDLWKITDPGGDQSPPPLVVDYTGSQERNGAWDANNKRGYFRSKKTGDLQTVFFQGSAVGVRTGTGNRGVMELYVDGKLLRTVDLKDRKAKDEVIVAHGFDPNFPHVLQVRVTQAGKRSRWVEVYGFEVYYIKSVGPGVYEEYEYDANDKPTRSDFIYEQNWQTVRYRRDPGPSGDHYAQTKHPESRAYLYFTDADAATIYARSGGFGTMEVYVNGELYGEFNQRGKKGFDKPFTITGFNKNSLNILELRAENKRKVTLDRVELYELPVLTPISPTEPAVYEDDGTAQNESGVQAPAMAFSGLWKQLSSSNASTDSYMMVGSRNDEVTFDVNSTTSVVIYRRIYKKYGSADVYVDGAFHSSFDNSNRSEKNGVWQQPHIIAGLDPGFKHRITIKPSVNKRGRWKAFDIDYIEVRGADAAGYSYLEDGVFAYDDAAALAGGAIQYLGSTWTDTGTNMFAKKKDEMAMVVFYGNAFSVTFSNDRKTRSADIYIDGEYVGTHDVNKKKGEAVPFAVGGLKQRMHVAQIMVKREGMKIESFRAYTLQPEEQPLYDFVTGQIVNPLDTFIISGDWSRDGDFIVAKKRDSSLYFYALGGDTMFILRELLRNSGDVEVLVNGEKFGLLDRKYVNKLRRSQPTEEVIFSGLAKMKTDGVWIQLRVKRDTKVSLGSLRIDELTPRLGVGQPAEAEGTTVHTSGYWQQKSLSGASGGKIMESQSDEARFYVAVQNVQYLTIYRPTKGGYRDADIYIDGEFWGVMSSQARRSDPSVPYSVGPIPNPLEPHVIELRPQHRRGKIAIDKIDFEPMNILGIGYYENDAEIDVPGVGLTPAFLYSGKWSEENDGNASGGSVHEAAKRGDRFSAVFEGNELVIYRRIDKQTRYATVYVDGTPYPLNNRRYNRTNHDQLAHTILLPTDGLHMLEVVNDSKKFKFDALEVRNTVPATFGAFQESATELAVNDIHLWNTVDSDQASGGALIQANKPYASAFLMFQGRRVTTYMTTGKNWGKVSFYLDGYFHDEVDLHDWDKRTNNPDEYIVQVLDITGLSDGAHVLEARFEGKKSRRGKPIVNLDAITVDGAPVPRPGEETPPSDPDVGGGGGGDEIDAPRAGCFEEASSEWLKIPEDGWVALRNTGASMDYYLVSPTVGEDDVYLEFDFAAEGFGLLYHKNSNAGIAQIWLDGAPLDAIGADGKLDMYSPDDKWLEDALLQMSGLDPNVIHVLRIQWTGEKNASSTNTTIYIDRIDLPSYKDIYNDNCIAQEN